MLLFLHTQKVDATTTLECRDRVTVNSLFLFYCRVVYFFLVWKPTQGWWIMTKWMRGLGGRLWSKLWRNNMYVYKILQYEVSSFDRNGNVLYHSLHVHCYFNYKTLLIYLFRCAWIRLIYYVRMLNRIIHTRPQSTLYSADTLISKQMWRAILELVSNPHSSINK